MAKALKYHYEFYDDINEVLKRVEIWVEGFVGDSTELKAGSTPLKRTYNKDVGEKYLGGVVQTSINIEAGSTDSFQAVEISSPNYGDVIIKHKIADTVLFNAIVVPFEGADIDLPSTYYNVSLGAECGLNKLASITYTHSGTRKKIVQVIKECLVELPYIDTFPIKVIDSTQVYGTEVLVGTDYWDTYIDDSNFKDDSCLTVIKKLIQVYNEIVFSDGAWYIRNIKEISTQDSDIHTFAWADLAKTTASYGRAATSVARRAGGSFGKLFSQQNIKITKGQSKLRNTFTEGDDLTGTGWTYSGGASLVFDFEDGKLGNSRATVYTPTFVGADNTYVESPFTTFYPFQEFFSTKEKERLVIKGLATKGNYIKHLRFQIRASSGGIDHYLTTEGTWYTEVSGLPTPIYEKTYSGDQEFNIDIPQPPYVTSGMLSSADRINIGEFGYFNGTDFTLPATNLAYDIYIRVYLPERTWDDPSMTGDEDYGKQLEVFIEYLRIEKADISGVVQNGFSRNYGVAETKDRKIDFTVELGVGYPSYPSGLDCLFLASSGESQGLSYGELNSLTSFEIDEFIAESYLNVLANQLKFYQGTVETDLEFTDIIEIDEIKYRIHNLEHDSRRNTSVVKLVELNSVDNVVDITPDITLSDDVIRNIDEQITKTLGSNLPIRYVDINFKETTLPTGERVIGLRDDFRKTSIYTEDAFLKASSNGLTKVITADTEDDFTWTVPAEEANRTFASREYLTETGWLLNGNALSASKGLGTTTAQDWTLIHESDTIATIKSTGLHLTNLTTNYLPKHTSGGLANSSVYDNGTNVGIGTTSPSQKLEVAGNILLSGSTTSISFVRASGTNIGGVGWYDDVFYLGGHPSYNAGAGNIARLFGFGDRISLGNANSGDVLNIGQDGRVGIGTTSPSELLHVNGTSRTTNLKITSGATVGYVWQCNNADGTGAWTTPLTSERYIGEWAANSGSAPSGSPTTGDYWVVNTAGTYSGTTYAAGDEIYWNGSTWLKRSNYLTLPTATSSILGGIKIGSNLAIDGSGVVTVTSSPILTTTRNIAITGDIAWNVNFNGSGNVTSSGTLATVNSNVGTFAGISVNGKGLVIGATTLTTLSGYGITDAWTKAESDGRYVDFDSDQDIVGVKNFLGGYVGFGEITFKDITVPAGAFSSVTYGFESTSSFTFSVPKVFGFDGTNIFSINSTSGLLLGGTINATSNPTERLQVNGNIRYNTLLKPNNIAGTSGQFLGTSGTQDIWTTLTTSHISNLSSYTGFDARYAPIVHTLDSHSNVTITSNTSGEILKWNGTSWINNTLSEAGVQARLNGTGYVKMDGTEVIYDNKTFVDHTTEQLSIGGNKGFTNQVVIQGITVGKGNTGSISNLTVGINSLVSLTTGTSLIGIGNGALRYNTSGAYNIGIGLNSLNVTTTGSENVSVGVLALAENTTGSTNTAIGSSALTKNTTGSNNIAVGKNAGVMYTFDPTNASQGVYLGVNAYSLAASQENEIVIGYNTVGNGSNTATFGNGSVAANYFNGTLKYGTLLKPNNVAGTNGQVLGTNGTQDSWVTLSTSYISDLNSYASFTNYYTETEVDSLLSGKQATLPSGSAGQFFVRDSTGALNFMDLKIKPIGLSSERIGVGNIDNFLGEQPFFLFKDKRYIQVSRITDSTKQLNIGLLKKSNNAFIEHIGGTLSIKASDGIYLSDFASPSRPLSMVTIDSLGKLSVSSISGGGATQASLTTNHVGFGINNVLSSSSNFTFLSDRYLHFTGASANVNIGATSSGTAGFMESVNGNLLLQARSTFGVVIDDGFFQVNDLAGTGIRMVVASSTGVLSTQAIPSGGGTPTLTATQIGFGSGSNLLSGSANFTFENDKELIIRNGSTSSLKIARFGIDNYQIVAPDLSIALTNAFDVTCNGLNLFNSGITTILGDEVKIGTNAENTKNEIGLANTGNQIILSGTSFKLNLSDAWGGSYTPSNGDKCVITYDSSKSSFVIQKMNTYNDGTRTYLIL